MYKLRDRFGYDAEASGCTGMHKFWYDGPIVAIWIWRFYIDLSYTRLANWLMRGWFDD